MRVLAALALAGAAAACGDAPSFDTRDVRCPDAGICPSGFACGYGDWCYAEDEPTADFEGEYMVTSTNGDNGCMLEDWVEGAVTNDIPVTITQDGQSIELTVDGLAGVFYNFYLGSNRFTGTVDGITAELAYNGNKEITLEDPVCTFMLNASGGAVLLDDVLEGHLDLIAVGATCEELMDCRMRVELSGVR